MYRPRKLIAALTLTVATLATAACSDSPVDPAAKGSLQPNQAHYLIATTSTSTVVLYPQFDNVYVSTEGHRITIPAYSVCDPVTSGYGPSYWDRSCTPATLPIVFTITTTYKADGSSAIAIKPDVRFVPGKTVMAYLKDSVGARTPSSYIAYCTLATGCYDEGKYDSSMLTYHDPANGIVYRRLKHFSGYNVIFGAGCDTSIDPNCDGSSSGLMIDADTPSDPTTTTSLASGYITTTGRAKE